MTTPPVSQWRQITYDIKAPKEIVGYSSVQSVPRKQGEHDDGSGSTLAALRRRGLITISRGQVKVLGVWVPQIRVSSRPPASWMWWPRIPARGFVSPAAAGPVRRSPERLPR